MVCGESLSSPEFMHKEKAVVKTTDCEKVGKSEKKVDSDYVNRFCISTGPVCCGKLLWKSLWRMLKTMSFQQLFRCFQWIAPAVENCVYRFA
jgi:hypothetical protein